MKHYVFFEARDTRNDMRTLKAGYFASIFLLLFSVDAFSEFWTHDPDLKLGVISKSHADFVCVGTKVTLSLPFGEDLDTEHTCTDPNKDISTEYVDITFKITWTLKKDNNVVLTSEKLFYNSDGTIADSSFEFTPNQPGEYVVEVLGDDDRPGIIGQNNRNDPKVSDQVIFTILKVEITPSQKKVCACKNGQDVMFELTEDSYSPGGVTWSISPSGLINGAAITGQGDSATVSSGTLHKEYTITATSNDKTTCFDTATLKVLNDTTIGVQFGIGAGRPCLEGQDFDVWKKPKQDKCGNELMLRCENGYKLRYNGTLVGQCLYWPGRNRAKGWYTKDKCRFHSTYWKTWAKKNPADWVEYTYDCIADPGEPVVTTP